MNSKIDSTGYGEEAKYSCEKKSGVAINDRIDQTQNFPPTFNNENISTKDTSTDVNIMDQQYQVSMCKVFFAETGTEIHLFELQTTDMA